jgi:hypothetical protein
MCRISRLILALSLIAGVIVARGGNATLAQGPREDWTAPYAPALLPAHVGDMAAFSDAPHYTIDLRLTVGSQAATVSGYQVVTYTNRTTDTPLPDIVFRLYPNLPSYGGTMTVGDVSVDGTPAELRLDATGSVLTVLLPEPLLPGERVTLAMGFAITLTRGESPLYGQFSYVGDVLALPNAYPVLSVYETGAGWWQVTEHPQGDAVYSRTGFYAVTITAPPEQVIVASGSAITTTANADGSVTHHYVAPLVRDFALMASPSYTRITGVQDGVTVNVYYRAQNPADDDAADAALAMTLDTVRIFNAAFGPYPFAELDVVETHNTVGGLEYPGLFVVGSGIWRAGSEYFAFIVTHEAAHQWWYSLVGNDQTRDPWLDEALAQFSVALFIRVQEGEAAYEAALASYRRRYEGYAAQHPALGDPVIGLPVTAYPGQAYFDFLYQKSPLFFVALADAYGYDTLLRMLQDYFAAYRYREVKPADMLHSFEGTLGADLYPTFTEWIGVFPVG